MVLDEKARRGSGAMQKTNRFAFKEWAVVCEALGRGRQSVILRKGGIEEVKKGFRVEHEEFWLYPTYVHQQAGGIVAEARPMLDEVLAGEPGGGVVRIRHFAVVEAVHQVTELEMALALEGLHVWSRETVRQRFEYRRPGLFVLVVRLFAMPAAVELPVSEYYAGCKSWVELERELSTEGAEAVLSDGEFADQQSQVASVLGAAMRR